jgi:hypothetical protein
MDVSMMLTSLIMAVLVVLPSWFGIESAGMEEHIAMSWREEQ